MLHDSNVYGSVVGLWRPSNSFHSPTRATLYSMPYTALSNGLPKMRRAHAVALPSHARSNGCST